MKVIMSICAACVAIVAAGLALGGRTAPGGRPVSETSAAQPKNPASPPGP